MLLRSMIASGLFVLTTYAFQDTSPFFAFSTSDSLNIPSRQIATSDQLIEDLRSNELDSDVYIVVSQPGVSLDDFQSADATPHMRRRLMGEDETIKSRVTIPEVMGRLKPIEIDANLPLKADRLLKDHVHATIESTGITFRNAEYPYTLWIDLPALPTSGERRTQQLAEHDTQINSALESLARAAASVTLFYTSSPPSAAVYASQRSHSEPTTEKSAFDWETEHASPDALHIDLKRDVTAHVRKRSNITLNEGAPLFEKYNFFSPGIFMGLLVMLILFSIGSVGVKALGGLQVSYAAFSKENGPQGQKKSQQ